MALLVGAAGNLDWRVYVCDILGHWMFWLRACWLERLLQSVGFWRVLFTVRLCRRGVRAKSLVSQCDWSAAMIYVDWYTLCSSTFKHLKVSLLRLEPLGLDCGYQLSSIEAFLTALPANLPWKETLVLLKGELESLVALVRVVIFRCSWSRQGF
jgi:hypothetical protein